MIATTEEQRLLEKWQKKLCLQEWRIKLVTHLRPEEMSVSNATALYRSTLKRHWCMSCCT